MDARKDNLHWNKIRKGRGKNTSMSPLNGKGSYSWEFLSFNKCSRPKKEAVPVQCLFGEARTVRNLTRASQGEMELSVSSLAACRCRIFVCVYFSTFGWILRICVFRGRLSYPVAFLGQLHRRFLKQGGFFSEKSIASVFNVLREFYDWLTHS